MDELELNDIEREMLVKLFDDLRPYTKDIKIKLIIEWFCSLIAANAINNKDTSLDIEARSLFIKNKIIKIYTDMYKDKYATKPFFGKSENE
jgi:hypothetical protein